MRNDLLAGAMALAAVVLPATAGAEVLSVEGVYPAGNDAAVAIERIGVETFDGANGTALSFAVSDALQEVAIDGEPWFEVVPATGGPTGAVYIYDSTDIERGLEEDPAPEVPTFAVLRGTSSFSASDTRIADRKRTKCLAKDDKGKCVSEEVTLIECRSLTVTLNAMIRLIAADGAIVHSDSSNESTSRSFCADDSTRPNVDEMVTSLIGNFARKTRLALAPREFREDIRVLETRKDMAKPARGPFRDAVKLTKNDPLGACMAFASLEAVDPANVSILFNIGLCMESEGRLAEAAEYYERALAIEPGKDYAQAGLRRINDRYRALDQLDARGRAPNAI